MGRASAPPTSANPNVDVAAADLAAETSPGHVFMFNMWKEDLETCSVNDTDLGPVKGFTQAPYAPFNIVVPRTLNVSEGKGKFTNLGTNKVVLQWGGDPITLKIVLTGVPMMDDLLFYAFPFGFWLMNLDGEIKAQGNYQTDGLA